MSKESKNGIVHNILALKDYYKNKNRKTSEQNTLENSPYEYRQIIYSLAKQITKKVYNNSIQV